VFCWGRLGAGFEGDDFLKLRIIVGIYWFGSGRCTSQTGGVYIDVGDRWAGIQLRGSEQGVV
jgi:hypothetical protein